MYIPVPVYVTVYVISELSLPPLYSGAVQERETLMFVTLDTVTLRGAVGDTAEWYRLLCIGCVYWLGECSTILKLY